MICYVNDGKGTRRKDLILLLSDFEMYLLSTLAEKKNRSGSWNTGYSYSLNRSGTCQKYSVREQGLVLRNMWFKKLTTWSRSSGAVGRCSGYIVLYGQLWVLFKKKTPRRNDVDWRATNTSEVRIATFMSTLYVEKTSDTGCHDWFSG